MRCGRILLVDGGDVVAEALGDVVELVGVVPDLVEELKVRCGHRRLVDPVDEVGNGVAPLVAEVDGGEAVQRHVGGLVRRDSPGELLHRRSGAVRAELSLPPHPVGAFLGDRPLGQLVAEPDLELAADRIPARGGAMWMKFSSLPLRLVRYFVRDEGRRSENELEGLDSSNSAFRAS